MHEAGEGGDGGRVWSRGRDALAGHHAVLEAGGAPRELAAGGARFSVGGVLGPGLVVWSRNFVPFVLITALFFARPWIWAIHVVHGEQTLEALRAGFRAFVIASMLTVPLNVFVAATLTYGVVMELAGQRASIGACMAT